jgi:hypothetical protein
MMKSFRLLSMVHMAKLICSTSGPLIFDILLHVLFQSILFYLKFSSSFSTPPPFSVNFTRGPAMSRQLLTGAHVVADIYCLQCQTKIGWMYDDATNEEQKYKIGKLVLELALIARRGHEVEPDGMEEQDEPESSGAEEAEEVEEAAEDVV